MYKRISVNGYSDNSLRTHSLQISIWRPCWYQKGYYWRHIKVQQRKWLDNVMHWMAIGQARRHFGGSGYSGLITGIFRQIWGGGTGGIFGSWTYMGCLADLWEHGQIRQSGDLMIALWELWGRASCVSCDHSFETDGAILRPYIWSCHTTICPRQSGETDL